LRSSRHAVVPGRGVMRTRIGGLSVAVVLTLTSAVQAQHKYPPPEKFAPPVQSAPQPKVQEPAARPAEPPVAYSPWVKFCGRDRADAQAKETCLTVKEARLETGQFLAGAALIEPVGEGKRLFRVTLPLGMQLMPGVRMFIDGDTPSTGNFIVCIPNGCMADFDVTADFVSKLKSGRELRLQGINMPGQVATYLLPLTDFARANEGLPTDPVQFEKNPQRRNAPPPSLR
jgi:invasion protein IalB